MIHSIHVDFSECDESVARFKESYKFHLSEIHTFRVHGYDPPNWGSDVSFQKRQRSTELEPLRGSWDRFVDGEYLCSKDWL